MRSPKRRPAAVRAAAVLAASAGLLLTLSVGLAVSIEPGPRVVDPDRAGAADVAPIDLQEREILLRDRVSPWARRARQLMDRVASEGDERPGDLRSAALEHAASMPAASGPESGGTDSTSQSVPGDYWRNIGPAPIQYWRGNVTGRIRSIVATGTSTIYIGAASGGVWKTTNGGTAWTPMSDFEESLAIGTLVQDPQDGQILYAGTGEYGGAYWGVGVLRSTDGGATWTLLAKNRFYGHRISKLVPDPTSVSDPATQRVLYASATNGFWRSADGGQTWTLIRSGTYSDAVMDPNSTGRLFVAEQGRSLPGGSWGGGLWKYEHGGSGMQKITDGNGVLPTHRFGRINLAAADDGGTVVFASMQDTYYGSDLKGIWKSDNLGATWSRVTGYPRQWADGSFTTLNLYESEASWQSGVNDSVGTADTALIGQAYEGNIPSSGDVDMYEFTLAGRDSFNAEIIADRAGSALNPKLSLLDASGNPVYFDGKPYAKTGGLKRTDGSDSSDSRLVTGWKTIPAGTYHLKVESADGTTGSYQVSVLGIDLGCQCAYDQALTVDPTNPDVLYMGLVSFFRSTDGGDDWTEIQDHPGGTWIHQDVHTVVVDPVSPQTIYVGSDGGIWKSTNRGDTWTNLNTNLSITQPYKASQHPGFTSFMLIGNQDNATAKLEGGLWSWIGDGDGGGNAIVDVNEYYYSAQNAGFRKMDPVKGDIGATSGLPGAGAAFITPLELDPNNSQVLITGGGEVDSSEVVHYRVYRTTNGAASWSATNSDWPRHVLALAIAPSSSNVYYAGTNTPNPTVRRTGNAGSSWDDITWLNIPNRQIGDIAVHPTDPNTVYVVFTGYGAGHVFRSTNGGTTWQDVGRAPHGNGSLPPGISTTPLPNVPVHTIVVDPGYPNTLFVGTDIGVFRTTDGGVNWATFNQGLPNVPVYDLILSTTTGPSGKFRAATHGRGVFELVPGNDLCENAEVVTDGWRRGSTRGATSDGNATCGATLVSPDVWYQYTATCDGELRVDTCGSSFDTVVSIHDASCPGGTANELSGGCNDDCAGGPCTGSVSCVAPQVTQGSTYLIRVSGWNGSSGDFELNVSCDVPNDACDDAELLGVGSNVSGSTRGAYEDYAPTCNGFDNTSAGVWYTVIGTGNTMTASTCGSSGYDTKLSVYCAGCGGKQCVTANDDTCGLQSQVSWCAAPGRTYHILVHGYQTQEGPFDLQITDNGTACPFYLACVPGNDTCGGALEWDGSAMTGDNTDAGTSTTASCQATSGDVWFEYEPRCHGFATVDTCGSTGTLADTVLSIHDTCGGEELACNDDACGLYSEATVQMEPDRPFHVRVADYAGDGNHGGTFTLDLDAALTTIDAPWPELYTTDGDGTAEDHLFRLDPERSTRTDVGALGEQGITGMAWTPRLGLMYAVNDEIDEDQVVTIDLQTGVVTPFADLGYPSVQSLAYDPSGRKLYAVDYTSARLLVIDTFTGATTAVGSLGFAEVKALAYDPFTDTLYGADTWLDQLITIDTATGAGTSVGSFGAGFGGIEGLAYDTSRRVLWGVHRDAATEDGTLVSIDTATGAATGHGSWADLGPWSLAWVEGLPAATEGTPYTAEVGVAGGCPGYWFSGVMGLPAGLTMDDHGKITGTPTANEYYTTSFDVSDTNLSTPYESFSLPLAVRPENDACGDPLLVTSGTYPLDTRAALTDGPPEPGICDYFAYDDVGSDVWYCYEADCTGSMTVSTCGSGYDTKLALYEGCGCPGSPSAVACTDDDCGAQSELTRAVTAGEVFTIRVGGYSGAQGTGTLAVSCAGVAAGGCCTGTACSVETAADCATLGGTYLGDGGDCGLDADTDGIVDFCDGCPGDPRKSEPGICGCGSPDFDLDSDGLPDCIDDDVDGDGILDIEDSHPLDPFRCIDADGDECDDCLSGNFDPANDGTDVDGDGWCDLGDCDDGDLDVWAPPGGVQGLSWLDDVTLAWDPPFFPGATTLLYDTIRSIDASDFLTAVCVEIDGTDLMAFDPDPMDPGDRFFYLVRPENPCGFGPLGEHSNGAPRTARSCP